MDRSQKLDDSVFKLKYIDSVPSLSKAAAMGDLELINILMRKGHLPHAADNRGWTAVHSCVGAKQLDALKLMLKYRRKNRKFLTNLRTWEGESPLVIAVKSDPISVEIVKTLLESGADPNLATPEGMTALHFACRRSGNLDVVKLLVRYGSDSNARDTVNEHTPLYIAIVEAADLEVVEFLSDVSELKRTNSFLDTPLYGACLSNFLEAAKIILEKDTSALNTISKMNISPLSAAAWNGNLELVQLLLDAGADTAFEGNCVVGRHFLKHGHFLPIHSSAGSISVFRLLLKNMEPSVLEDYDKKTDSVPLPIFLVMIASSLECLEALMQYPFPSEFGHLKMVTFSKLTAFILRTAEYFEEEEEEEMIRGFRIFFKYYSYFEPEKYFEHFTKMLTNNELLVKCDFLYILAQMGISSGDSFNSKNHIITLICKFLELGERQEKLLAILSCLRNSVLSLKQLSRVVARRVIRSRAGSDWLAYTMIRDSCLPAGLKNYLWYQI